MLFSAYVCTILPFLILTVDANYRIGVGISDCTGPAAEIVFMGYAKAKQKGCGIHLRQFSRAFIFDDGQKRAAFISVDAGMMGQGVRRAVLENLQKQYGDIYNEKNTIISGTHTHSGPGGFLMDLLLDISTFGFVRESFQALVNGITKSVISAHENIVKARIFYSIGELLHANINRSPSSYLLNPEEERKRYQHDVDKQFVQLKFVRESDGVPMGAINWFAVHPTSMNNTNCLVSSDNVGYASIRFEQLMNNGSLPGKGKFVGAFASTNLGDVSPNIRGPKCVDTGESCEMISSTCNGNAQKCIASGPGRDMFESTKIIGERLYEKARELFVDEMNAREVTGTIDFIHQYNDMPKKSFKMRLSNGTLTKVKGCLPAMGYSFAAGTTDGPGEFDFSQGTVTSNDFWNTIRDFIFPPTQEDIACHHPKPILINTGRISKPYQWQSRIVSTQLLLLGDVVIAAVPGEFTTMAGRRLRGIIRKTFSTKSGKSVDVIIAGLSNIYTSYITTPEEYQLQRYEGASTIYGPHTLTLYLKIYQQLAMALIKGKKLDPGPTPPDFSSRLLSFVPPVLFDTAGWNRNFGDCLQQPQETATAGDTVVVRFVSGHPRNDRRQGGTFVAVERQTGETWTVMATDANWETRFIWKRTSHLGGSQAIITWEIGPDVPKGTYRIRHLGVYKYILGGTHPYEGITKNFEII